MKSEQYQTITRLLASARREEAAREIDRYRGQLSDAEYLECLGNVAFYDKDFAAAILRYEQAMETYPEHDCARYHYLVGVQLERSNKLQDAFLRYQAAIEIEPTFVDSYVELGVLLCKVNDLEGALQCCSDAVTLDPSDLGLYRNLVTVLTQLANSNSQMYYERLAIAKVQLNEATVRLTEPSKYRLW